MNREAFKVTFTRWKWTECSSTPLRARTDPCNYISLKSIRLLETYFGGIIKTRGRTRPGYLPLVPAAPLGPFARLVCRLEKQNATTPPTFDTWPKPSVPECLNTASNTCRQIRTIPYCFRRRSSGKLLFLLALFARSAERVQTEPGVVPKNIKQLLLNWQSSRQIYRVHVKRGFSRRSWIIISI